MIQLESLHTHFVPVFSMSVLPAQVNTGAAEVLYSAVGEWAQLDGDSTVLDVCCGTGTIGISLANVRFDVCSNVLRIWQKQNPCRSVFIEILTSEL